MYATEKCRRMCVCVVCGSWGAVGGGVGGEGGWWCICMLGGGGGDARERVEGSMYVVNGVLIRI